MSTFTPTERTQVKRLPKRGAYDRETVFKILDEAFVCHVGFVVDGQPYVIPTNFGRAGEIVYLHGSAASRMLRTLSEGIPVCVTEALRLFTEHIMKGRWDQIRQPNEQELKGTTVLALGLEEVSAKVRTGGPVDDEADYDLPIWAGVLPLPVTPAAPIPDARLKAGIAVPENVARYSRNANIE